MNFFLLFYIKYTSHEHPYWFFYFLHSFRSIFFFLREAIVKFFFSIFTTPPLPDDYWSAPHLVWSLLLRWFCSRPVCSRAIYNLISRCRLKYISKIHSCTNFNTFWIITNSLMIFFVVAYERKTCNFVTLSCENKLAIEKDKGIARFMTLKNTICNIQCSIVSYLISKLMSYLILAL